MTDEYITIKIKKKVYDELTKDNYNKGQQMRTISTVIDMLIEKSKRCDK